MSERDISAREATWGERGLYLAPASTENIKETILVGVDISIAEKYLVASDFNELKTLLGDERRFHCWAMTESSRSEFCRMERGDIVLFVEKGTGFFTWQAEVLFTTESEEMGKYLWTYAPYQPWKLIYFLKGIQDIRIDKKELVVALGYKPTYEVPGVIRVKDGAVREISRQCGSIQEFISMFSKEKSLKRPINDVNMTKPTLPDAKIVEEIKYERPDVFQKLIHEIAVLKSDPEHKERAHESLVEYFYELLNFDRHTDIKYRQGRVDIIISHESKPMIVNEVKKDWDLSWRSRNVAKQGYGYAIENGARFVVITNGDYYAFFDRSKGLDLESNLLAEICVTKLNKLDLSILERFKKENLSNFS